MAAIKVFNKIQRMHGVPLIQVQSSFPVMLTSMKQASDEEFFQTIQDMLDVNPTRFTEHTRLLRPLRRYSNTIRERKSSVAYISVTVAVDILSTPLEYWKNKLKLVDTYNTQNQLNPVRNKVGQRNGCFLT